jgi:OHCU decarboxylase
VHYPISLHGYGLTPPDANWSGGAKVSQAKLMSIGLQCRLAGAGLDSLIDDGSAAFTELNTKYMRKFDFPFIIAVKGLSKTDISTASKIRVENEHEVEFATACRQMEKIALLRLKDLLP